MALPTRTPSDPNASADINSLQAQISALPADLTWSQPFSYDSSPTNTNGGPGVWSDYQGGSWFAKSGNTVYAIISAINSNNQGHNESVMQISDSSYYPNIIVKSLSFAGLGSSDVGSVFMWILTNGDVKIYNPYVLDFNSASTAYTTYTAVDGATRATKFVTGIFTYEV